MKTTKRKKRLRIKPVGHGFRVTWWTGSHQHSALIGTRDHLARVKDAIRSPAIPGPDVWRVVRNEDDASAATTSHQAADAATEPTAAIVDPFSPVLVCPRCQGTGSIEPAEELRQARSSGRGGKAAALRMTPEERAERARKGGLARAANLAARKAQDAPAEPAAPEDPAPADDAAQDQPGPAETPAEAGPAEDVDAPAEAPESAAVTP